VLEIFLRAHVLHPVGVTSVPLNGFAKAVLELNGRLPAQLTLDLAAVDRIPAIVPGTVLDVIDEGRRLVASLEQGVRKLQVRLLAMAANVVDLPDLPATEHRIDGPAMVADVNPVTDIESIAVDGNRDITLQVGNKQRDQLFRELVGTVVVGAASN